MIVNHDEDEAVISVRSWSGATDFYRMEGNHLTKLSVHMTGYAWSWIMRLAGIALFVLVTLFLPNGLLGLALTKRAPATPATPESPSDAATPAREAAR